MKTIKLLAVVALLVAVTACCACRRGRSSVPLVGTEWHLAQLYGTSVVSDNYRMTLAPEGRVSGVGDCNRFSGTFTQEDKTLKIADNLVSTRMMCLDQAREDKFLGMLREIDSYSIDGERLMLIKSGDVLAIFDRVVPDEPATAQ